jgi:hypothetical protein
VTANQPMDPKTNTSLKIPTNMINPNEFYQKTVAKNKNGGLHSENLHNQGANLKPAYKQNINSARVESRKMTEDAELNKGFHKKRFSNKFEKGVYKISEDDVSLIRDKDNLKNYLQLNLNTKPSNNPS